MDEVKINPFVKSALELGPPILFFIAYLWVKDETYTIAGHDYSGFIVATLIFVPILLVCMAILWKLTGHLSRLQIFTAIIVIFFGGLTEHWKLWLGLVLLAAVLFARGGITALIAGRERLG